MEEKTNNENLFNQDANSFTEKEIKYKTAGFWIRLFAFIFDIVIIYFINAIFIHYLLQYLIADNCITMLFDVSQLFIGLTGSIYFVLMTKYYNQTLGKMLTGIMVISGNGSSLDWNTVIFRELIGRTISQLMGLNFGYLVSLFNKKKQTLHDFIGDTYVVYIPNTDKKRFVTIKD